MSKIVLHKRNTLESPSTDAGAIQFDANRLAFCWVDQNAAAWFQGKQRCSLTSDLSGVSDANLVNATGLVFPLVSGLRYAFEFGVIWRTSNSAVALKLALTVPAFTIFAASVLIQGYASDGLSALWSGTIKASGDAVVCTQSEEANVDYLAVVRGRIKPSANGSLQVQYAAETTGGTVTVKECSSGELWML